MAKKATKKPAKKKSATPNRQRLFSLVALHNAFQKAQDRLATQPQTAAAKKLGQDLTNSRAMIACGQTMSPDIA
jgi:hypothetical protein